MDADILQELLDQQEKSILSQVDERIVAALIQKNQSPQKTDDAILWKNIFDILSEESADAPNRLMNCIAQYAKYSRKPRGEEIYQHAGNICRRFYE